MAYPGVESVCLFIHYNKKRYRDYEKTKYKITQTKKSTNKIKFIPYQSDINLSLIHISWMTNIDMFKMAKCCLLAVSFVFSDG